eukprot:370666_1
MSLSAYEIYGIVMCAVCVICGSATIYFVCQFKSYTNTRFLKSHTNNKPSLTILYSYASAFTLLVLSPTHILLQGNEFHIHYVIMEDIDHFFWMWLLHFIQEFIVSCMLIVIAARCWLLYYNHSYTVSLVDKNWKGAISTNDGNFWLKYRRTWGEFDFIVCVGIACAVLILVTLSSISIAVLTLKNLTLLHFVSLSVVNLPCCALISVIMFKNKMKNLHLYDEFMVFKEVQYLSLSTVLVVVISILECLQFQPMDLVIPGHVCFAFLSSYIQTRWVVQQLRKRTLAMFQKQTILKSGTPANVPKLTMSDILKSKDGFTMFMRHCQGELNVEGLLFIVEVAQYKAQLYDVIHQYESQDREQDTHDDSELPVISPNVNSPSLLTLESHSERSTAHVPLQIDEKDTEETIDLPRLKMLSSRVRRQSTDTPGLEKFGGNILSREWMPISNQLFRPKGAVKKRHSAGNVLELETMSTELQVAMLTDDKSCKLNQAKDDQKRKEISRLQVEDDGMYEYAQHLFLKYIDADSNFTINVSYASRKELLLFFSHDQERGFQYILDQSGVNINTDTNAKAHQLRSMVIKQYLYHVFDRTLSDVWKLLLSDTYVRFMQTKQYQYLVEHQK